MNDIFRPTPRALLIATFVFGTGWLAIAGDARASLLRPDARQSFPDLAGDIVGTQSYVFDEATGLGTFSVNNTPTLLATGPNPANEFFVVDSAATARSQTLAIKLDSGGNLVNDPSNRFDLYGTVVVDGERFSGLLLQGIPTRFGWAAQNPATPTMSVYDVDMTLTGGKLLEAYGTSAYLRIITETDSTFDGTFTRNFNGSKALTNLRSYNATSPNPIPEPSTFVVLLAFGTCGVVFGRRRRIAPRDLRRP